MPNGIARVVLKLDLSDLASVRTAVRVRRGYVLPAAVHDDANEAGVILADICRAYLDFVGESNWLNQQPGDLEG